MKSSSSDQDVWADECQILCEDECTPQIPKGTKQFCNTLKSNKGKANKADFERMDVLDFPSRGPRNVAKSSRPGSRVLKTLFKFNHLKYSKPKSQSYGCALSFSPDKMQCTQLRKIPSSDILKSLRG
ncbi:unnamed protein product [Moneuplotes crassus]|uniref:Uncharacterized protein n=1 Tax=Euplotes crassus TaxID=5936 RepID=A0AAD1YA12_EUPCR|nr:unnamed protein product [Moneuplotes crassus]